MKYGDGQWLGLPSWNQKQDFLGCNPTTTNFLCYVGHVFKIAYTRFPACQNSTEIQLLEIFTVFGGKCNNKILSSKKFSSSQKHGRVPDPLLVWSTKVCALVQCSGDEKWFISVTAQNNNLQYFKRVFLFRKRLHKQHHSSSFLKNFSQILILNRIMTAVLFPFHLWFDYQGRIFVLFASFFFFNNCW